MTTKQIRLQQMPNGMITTMRVLSNMWGNGIMLYLSDPSGLYVSDLYFDLIKIERFYDIFKKPPAAPHMSDRIMDLYPVSMVYPAMFRVLALNHFSAITMLKMLSIKSRIIALRPLVMGEAFSLTSSIDTFRKTKKGLELDIKTTIFQNDVPAWINTKTLFFKGMGANPESDIPPFHLSPVSSLVSSGAEAGEYELDQKKGAAFCRLAGDSNGIHYSTLYARMLGYKNAFSQPYYAVGCYMDLLERQQLPDYPYELYLEFKGPLYFGGNVIARSVQKDASIRFDLFSGDSEKPGILGEYRSI